MPVKLPDSTALGALDSSAPALSGLPRVHEGGAGAVAAGIESIGAGIEKVSAANSEYQRVTGTTDWDVGKTATVTELNKPESLANYGDLEQRSEDALRARAEPIIANITDPKARFIVSNQIAREIAGYKSQFAGIAVSQNQDANAVALGDKVKTYQATLATHLLDGNEDAVIGNIKQVGDLYRSNVTTGRIKATAAQAAQEKYYSDGIALAINIAKTKPNPEEGIAALQTLIDKLTKARETSPAVLGAPGPQSDLSGGAAYLAQRRSSFKQELDNDPQTRKLLGAVISAENPGAGPAVAESLFNRTELVNQDRANRGLPPVTLKQMMLGHPNRDGGFSEFDPQHSFYGPIRNGSIQGHLANADAMGGRIDQALNGSNTIEGHTDQGSRNDPNYYAGGTGININGERFNHWGFPGSREFQAQLQSGYADAEVAGTKYASLNTGTAADSTAGPSQNTKVASVSSRTDASMVPSEQQPSTPRDFYNLVGPLQRETLINTAQSALNALIVDQERQAKLQAAQVKEVSNGVENEMIKALIDKPSTLSASAIANDDRLTNETKLKWINPTGGIVSRANKPEPDSKISAQVAKGLLDLIHRDPGDPLKMTSVDPIYKEFTGPDAKLTKTDFEFARKEFFSDRDNRGQSIEQSKKDFLKSVEPMIDKSNPLMGKIDQSGKQQMYRFQYDLQNKMDEYQKANKNVRDLFDPSKPDYMGNPAVLDPYQKKLTESIQDRVRSLAGKPSTASPLSPAAPAPAAAPQVEPRKPGETPADYLKRTGKL